jgi:hypothetical protein
MPTLMIELLPVLQIANLAIQIARNQIPPLQEHRERCNLLVNRCERLLDEVSAQYAVNQTALVQKKVVLLESYVLILHHHANASPFLSFRACLSVRDTITELAEKGLAWRLIHQERMEKALVAAEGKLIDAFFAFHVCFCTAGNFF